MLKLSAIIFSLTLVVTPIFNENLFAQDSQTLSRQKTIAENLPELHDGSPAGLIINSANFKSFSKIIIPEMQTLVRGGKLELDAVKTLRFQPAFQINFNAGAKDVSSVATNIENNGSLPQGFRPGNIFPFADYEKFRSEKDTKLVAYKVLHNLSSIFWARKFIDQNFSLIWLQDDKVINQVHANFKRAYPLALNQEDKSIQAFREKVSLLSPSVVAGYTWLTFRFFSDDEDMLWVNSVALGKVRQLTGSNRSDSIFKSAFSLDDFYVWSGKPEMIEPRIDSDLLALVPFAEKDPQLLKKNESCYGAALSENNQKKQKWNFETKKNPQTVSWQPVSSVFIPRKLIKLELIPKDPYSLYGRQILYLDAELMLPYYKVVYDRSGFLWKFIMAAYKQNETSDKSFASLDTDYIVIEDRKNNYASIVDMQNLTQCEKYPANLGISDFDPQKISSTKASPKQSKN